MNRHSGTTPLDRRAFVGASLAAGAALLGVPESASGSESPVRPLVVIALHIRSREAIEVLLAENQKVVDAFD